MVQPWTWPAVLPPLHNLCVYFSCSCSTSNLIRSINAFSRVLISSQGLTPAIFAHLEVKTNSFIKTSFKILFKPYWTVEGQKLISNDKRVIFSVRKTVNKLEWQCLNELLLFSHCEKVAGQVKKKLKIMTNHSAENIDLILLGRWQNPLSTSSFCSCLLYNWSLFIIFV